MACNCLLNGSDSALSANPYLSRAFPTSFDWSNLVSSNKLPISGSLRSKTKASSHKVWSTQWKRFGLSKWSTQNLLLSRQNKSTMELSFLETSIQSWKNTTLLPNNTQVPMYVSIKQHSGNVSNKHFSHVLVSSFNHKDSFSIWTPFRPVLILKTRS